MLGDVVGSISAFCSSESLHDGVQVANEWMKNTCHWKEKVLFETALGKDL